MQVHTSSRQHMRREMLGEIVRQPHRVATFDNDDFALSNGCHGHVYCCIGIGASARGRLSVSSRIKSPQRCAPIVPTTTGSPAASRRITTASPSLRRTPKARKALLKCATRTVFRSEEHTSELQSLMRITYTV